MLKEMLKMEIKELPRYESMLKLSKTELSNIKYLNKTTLRDWPKRRAELEFEIKELESKIDSITKYEKMIEKL